MIVFLGMVRNILGKLFGELPNGVTQKAAFPVSPHHQHRVASNPGPMEEAYWWSLRLVVFRFTYS